MWEIIKVERKRVLNNRLLLMIIALILIYSVCSSLSSLQKFNVHDQNGNVVISAEENLKESKKGEHNLLLDDKVISNIVEGKDTSRYLYNSNLIKLIASNYNKKLKDLTEQNISDFYKQRVLNVGANIGGTAQISDINALTAKAAQLTTPIRIGYAEGWKVLNNELTDFCTVLVYFIPFIILFIFGKTPKVKMDELCVSSKYGKKRLIKAKIATAFILVAFIYFTAIAIYSLSKLLTLGFDGGNLPIQGSLLYLFCPYNITFLEQYLINVFLGFMASMLLVSFTILITVLLKQIMSSAIVVTLLLIIMPLLPNNNFYFNFYIKNFLPFNITNFNIYYIHPYIYNVFGRIFPAYAVVICMALIICVILILLTYLLLIEKFKGYRHG